MPKPPLASPNGERNLAERVQPTDLVRLLRQELEVGIEGQSRASGCRTSHRRPRTCRRDGRWTPCRRRTPSSRRCSPPSSRRPRGFTRSRSVTGRSFAMAGSARPTERMAAVATARIGRIGQLLICCSELMHFAPKGCLLNRAVDVVSHEARGGVRGNAGGGKSTRRGRLPRRRDRSCARSIPSSSGRTARCRVKNHLAAHAELMKQDTWIIDGFGCVETARQRLRARRHAGLCRPSTRHASLVGDEAAGAGTFQDAGGLAGGQPDLAQHTQQLSRAVALPSPADAALSPARARCRRIERKCTTCARRGDRRLRVTSPPRKAA